MHINTGRETRNVKRNGQLKCLASDRYFLFILASNIAGTFSHGSQHSDASSCWHSCVYSHVLWSLHPLPPPSIPPPPMPVPRQWQRCVSAHPHPSPLIPLQTRLGGKHRI